jgi:hypothetical protein
MEKRRIKKSDINADTAVGHNTGITVKHKITDTNVCAGANADANIINSDSGTKIVDSDKNIKHIVFRAKRTKNVRQLKPLIEKLGFREVTISKDIMSIKIVERETIKGSAYLYITITFDPGELRAEYNIPKEYSKPLREFEVATLMLRILLVTQAYKIKPEKVYNIIFSVFSTVHDILTTDYTELKSKHDTLTEEYIKLKHRYKETEKINEKINKTMLEIEKNNQMLTEKVKTLESISNETLQEIIVDWLKTNRGIMQVSEFAKEHDLAPARVEQGLDMLMKKGIIEKVK